MKKAYKNIFAVLLSFVMLFTLVACSGVQVSYPRTLTGEGDTASDTALPTKETNSWTVSSPDKTITVSVGMDNLSNLYYSVKKGSVDVVLTSALGLEIDKDDLNFLTFDKKITRNVSGQYSNLSGRHSQVEYEATELQLTFKTLTHKLDVFVRAYDDGYAFRYKLDSLSGAGETVKVLNEKSSFTLPAAALTWRQRYQPYTDYTVIDALKNYDLETFAYERSTYTYLPASGIDNSDQIAFPLLYRPDSYEDVYSLVTESALIGSGFYGSVLEAVGVEENEPVTLKTVPTPAGSIKDDGYVTLPFTSPWRVGIAGDLATVVESELVEKVYDDVEYWTPDDYDGTPEEYYDWVDPDVACWSWIMYRAADQKNFAIHKAYLDKCAEMGWKYILLDGSWSAEYMVTDKIQDNNSAVKDLSQDGISTDGVPGDWNAFIDYANKKGIKVMVWGDAIRTFGNADYNVLCDMLDKWQAMGVAGVKLDFWDGERQLRDGHQYPNNRCEDSGNIAWYETVYQECAKRHLLVNCHGSNKPTGERRVYPNVINREGIYGAEMNANTAAGTINQLFTRNIIGPADFTPLVKPRGQRFTTGFMITLPFLFDGMTTVGDTLTNLSYEPIQELYKSIPVLRDDTKFLCGEPDEYYVAAIRNGDEWIIAGVTDGARKLQLDLSFLGEGNFSGYSYFDGALDSNQKTTVVKTAVSYTSQSKVDVDLAERSGFVIHLTKQP